jgi:hypothetical protein
MTGIVAAGATPSGGREYLRGERGHRRDPADQMARNARRGA